MKPDMSRILRCKDCTGNCLRKETGTWVCSSCERSTTDLQMDLPKEETLVDATRKASEDFEAISCECLRKMCAVAEETLGEKHFVVFHTQLLLFRRHLVDANKVLGDEALIEQMKSDLHIFKRRLFLPAYLLFRRLEKWVEAYAPELRYVLLPEAVYKLVKALGRSSFMGDAVTLALQYFAVNRAAFGDHNREAQLFRTLLAQHPEARAELAESCLRPGCGKKADRLCKNCGLATYCCVPCEARDRGEHGYLCITATGRKIPNHGQQLPPPPPEELDEDE